MSSNLYVYHIGPIDNWTGWTPLRELLVQDVEKQFFDSWPYSPELVMTRWQNAQYLARSVGWEGDIRKGEGPMSARYRFLISTPSASS